MFLLFSSNRKSSIIELKFKFMLEKFRKHYEEKLYVKIITVIVVVLLAMSVMLPLVLVAELFGVNLRENNGTNLKVSFANIILFFLFVCCATFVIWAAQKYIHKAKLFDLGFRTKFFKFILIGFTVGVVKTAVGYGVLILNASNVTYTSVIPSDVSSLTYIGYYLYFVFGLMILNSFVEELVTRAYPIEKLRKHINPHIIFIIMGSIFTAGHFFVRDFDLGYCLSLFVYSYTFSLLYHYSSSLWLVIGMHSGINWFGFSFFGTNWKLGALYHTEISGVPEWIATYSQSLVEIVVLLIVVLLYKKGIFKKISS